MKINWIFVVSLASSMIGALIFGFLKQPAEMSIMVVAGAIGMAFANIDKIQRFKGAGFEAEMKKAVEEAYATTDSLKELAKVLASVSIFSLAYENRWAGINKHTKHILKEKIDNVCMELNIDDASVKEANEIFYWMFANDHLKKVLHFASKENQNNEQMRKIEKKFSVEIGSNLPSVTEIAKELSALEVNDTSDILNAIDNYDYYLKNHKLRSNNAI